MLKTFEKTSLLVNDISHVRNKLSFSFIRKRILLSFLLLALFSIFQGLDSIWLERDPLVLAWWVVGLLFAPIGFYEATQKNPDKRVATIAVFAIFIVFGFVILWVNEAIWVKRVVSIFALLAIVFCLVRVSLTESARRRRADFNERTFFDGLKFRASTALIVLTVNEAAILTNSDWLWIASKILLVFLIPFSIVVITKIIRPQ